MIRVDEWNLVVDARTLPMVLWSCVLIVDLSQNARARKIVIRIHASKSSRIMCTCVCHWERNDGECVFWD
jgi:hypothetical protein